MNKIKQIQTLNEQELEAGISIAGSWHNDYADSAYIYVGGLSPTLTEGDIVAIFAQYGNPVHVKLVRDKETGKSKGFAFIKYEDQRSTVLAVDNFNGVEVLGRKLVVDHTRYSAKEGEDEWREEQTMLLKEYETGSSRKPRRDDDSRRGSRRRSRSPRRDHREKPKHYEQRNREPDPDLEDPMKEYFKEKSKSKSKSTSSSSSRISTSRNTRSS